MRVICVLLALIFPLALFHLLYQEYDLKTKRLATKREFFHLCNAQITDALERKALATKYKELRTLDAQWRDHQKLRAKYYLWDLIWENWATHTDNSVRGNGAQ
jgi:hypothetical protein